jgi:hypothetical protein
MISYCADVGSGSLRAGTFGWARAQRDATRTLVQGGSTPQTGSQGRRHDGGQGMREPCDPARFFPPRALTRLDLSVGWSPWRPFSRDERTPR